jgi:hypothetical protein
MEKMDLVERVARAIDDATWTNFDNYAGLKGWTEEERNAEMLASRSIQKSLGNARAAIEAIELYRLQQLAETFSDKPPKWAQDAIDAAPTPPPSGQEM